MECVVNSKLKMLKKVIGYFSSFFPSFEPLLVEPNMKPEEIMNSLDTLPKEYLDPTIMEIAQAVKSKDASVLLEHMGNTKDVDSVKLECSDYSPRSLGTVCIVELARMAGDGMTGVKVDSESVLKSVVAANGLLKLKALLKEDKDEAHTYWTLVLLSTLCGKVT